MNTHKLVKRILVILFIAFVLIGCTPKSTNKSIYDNE